MLLILLPFSTLVYFRREKTGPNGGTLSFVCGGSLIASDIVLTAAHCIKEEPGWTYRPFVGAMRRDADNSGGEERTCTNIVSHPSSDVALCKLNAPVEIYPADARLTVNENGSLPSDGSRLTVVGLGTMNTDVNDPAPGAPDTLQEVDVFSISNNECKKTWKGDRITPERLCTHNTDNSGACRGDSGGPLVSKNPATGVHTMVGVVSGGSKICGNRPSYYVRVSSVATWIRNTACNTLDSAYYCA